MIAGGGCAMSGGGGKSHRVPSMQTWFEAHGGLHIETQLPW